MTPEDRAAGIARIRRFPDELRQIAATLTDAQLTARPIPGEWSVAQNIHHCADSHINSYVRLKLLLTEDRPPLKAYAEDRWGELPDATNADLAATFQILDGLHQRWMDSFEVLDEDGWRRVGVHTKDGDLSAEDLLGIYVNHCNAHLEQIGRTVAAL
ncbi:MAG: metal-dependent hydrolase [Acidimicrobiia bacterium]|nr:metal-dependent hydrolase [Acidimicrobiia bacterium]